MSFNRTVPKFVAISLVFIFGTAWISSVVASVDHAKVHIVYLGEKQHYDTKSLTDSHLDILTSVLGHKEAVVNSMLYSYRHGFSGFAAKITETQAEMISGLPGVVRVMRNQLHSVQTTRSWDYLGVSTSSPSNLLNKANMGDGIIIGLLDTGIWPESEVFNDEGLGSIPSRWNGSCESGQQFNATTDCNKKVIGAKWFIDGFLAENKQPFNTTINPDYLSPRDSFGHGTHTSTIAAGSFVANESFKGLGLGVVRGGVPRARIAMYKVCWNVPTGQCSSADLLKAFDEAIHDGVDLPLALTFHSLWSYCSFQPAPLNEWKKRKIIVTILLARKSINCARQKERLSSHYS